MNWWQLLALEKKADPAWTEGLEALASVDLPEREGQTLAAACRSPDQLRLLADLLRATPRETEDPAARARLFLSIVDESTASLAEWIAGLEILFVHLRRAGRDTSFGLALGYLQCCTDAVEGAPSLRSLPDVVEEMLQTHGFQG